MSRLPRPTLLAAALAATLGALLAGCQPDTGLNRLVPDMATAPDALDFGKVRLGTEAAQVVQVVNAGTGPLSVQGIGLTEDVGAFTLSPATLDLDASSSAEVIVTFAPDALSTYTTSLLLASNDPVHPLVTILLAGEGIEGGPDIDLDASSLDFGIVAVGSTSSQVLTISNVGDEDLEILPDTTQQGSGAFNLESDPRGEHIPPGGSFPVLVRYAPSLDGGDQGTLTLVSDDPDEPSVTVAFLGNGGGVDSYPVARIAATTQAEPGDTIILDGTGSYDPGGNEPLTYAWTLLEQPEASTSSLYQPTLSAPSLNLDTAGSYTVALQVWNTLGVASATAVHTVDAVPQQDVYVTLSWEGEDADLDLHLVQTDGGLLFDSSDDCCWCNENPDWGVSGTTDDDPLLAQDAGHGGGPEDTLIPNPADGEYFVRAHYFQDNGAGPSQATVRIYIHGELADQYRREMSHNQVWDVAYIRWPQGYVIEENADPYAAPVRSCQ